MLGSYGSRLAPIWLGAMFSYPVWLDYDIHVYGLPKSPYMVGCYVVMSSMLGSSGNHLAPLWLGAMLSCPVQLDYDIWLTKEPLYGLGATL